MKSFFPEIARPNLSEKDLEIFHSLDKENYGRELAGKVAEKLKRDPIELNEDGYYVGSGGLRLSHRDYCGTGLYFFEGKFTLGEVNDGMGPYPVLITFENQEEFVEWLASQSDQSMSLCSRDSFNNQTVTRIRLEYFLDDNYDPVWNSYCAYVKKRR
ncbi:hypothetical protein EDD80_10892 [Anseongella ginsenosidimutans]|uniref:Uncharacterized protein n=1 Tax=Anseongella ginsenosidimutans TaxID=496056 RepID=A0A4R3KNZ0_9SPHI|nr:hypothetical protein [Anseongella ginsenosidimutans]QEC53913.1 hypothetical protein FRZ59_17325 [Anseongella ginsenosidimutans]TCS86300.1 hypothetical protein EDD80_10892 [Anseongella ginsenosidimutans]